MNFNILDTESTYRRILATDDAAEREAIFRTELAEPFAGLAKVFGFGDDIMTAFKTWTMSPDQFAIENRAHMQQVMDMLAAADAWGQCARALEDGRAAFARYADRIPLETITFGLMLADMGSNPFNRGYTGFGGVPGWIMTVYDIPTPYNLERIKSTTVHEMHHNILGAVKPMDFLNQTTVADYMVMEGLAESFAAELYGEDKVGYFVTEFDTSRLDETKRIMQAGLGVTGFNKIRGYIFGGPMADVVGFEKVDLPIFAGYALGYHVVQAYVKRTGKSVVDATFVPAQEIVAESGYFE